MIFKKEYYINKPKATIIISHGIAEHSGRYEYVAKELNKNGYDVLTYDHIGHGKSSGKRGKIKSFHEHVDTLHKMVLLEKKRNNNKIFLLGHSMGGEVVNLYAIKYKDVSGIISIAAATKTPSNAKVLRYIGFWYLRFIGISPKIFDKHLAKDPNVLKHNKQDDLMLKKMYISLIGEMFVKGVKYIEKNYSEFKLPVIYLHGTSDKIVDPSASTRMFNKIKSEDKELKLYEGQLHEILNDYNKDDVIKDIVNWLDKRSN